jgi:hypothetical protein
MKGTTKSQGQKDPLDRFYSILLKIQSALNLSPKEN